MRLKKGVAKALVCLVGVGSLTLAAGAVDARGLHVTAFNDLDKDRPVMVQEMDMHTTRATVSFDLTVSPGKLIIARDSFPLEAGETVTINVSYSPSSASMDFGLIAPDGLFHYINTTDGNLNRTIQVDERGSYTFAVNNNSSSTVRVVGFVNY